MDIEIWKDIPWYEWFYQASNKWRIASLRFGKFKILWLSHHKKGYTHISIHGDNRKERRTCRTHILVYKSFKWDIPNLFQINHINWIKDDNRIENLEAVSASDNIKHSYKFLWRVSPSKWKSWKDCKSSKKVFQYSLDLELLKEWNSLWDITRDLWYRKTCISSCCKWRIKRMYWCIWKFIKL